MHYKSKPWSEVTAPNHPNPWSMVLKYQHPWYQYEYLYSQTVRYRRLDLHFKNRVEPLPLVEPAGGVEQSSNPYRRYEVLKQQSSLRVLYCSTRTLPPVRVLACAHRTRTRICHQSVPFCTSGRLQYEYCTRTRSGRGLLSVRAVACTQTMCWRQGYPCYPCWRHWSVTRDAAQDNPRIS